MSLADLPAGMGYSGHESLWSKEVTWMGNKGRFGLLSLVLTWTLALTVPAALLTVAPLTAEAAQTHEVLLLSRRVEGKPTPEFYFEPTGLYIEPGDTVRFV